MVEQTTSLPEEGASPAPRLTAAAITVPEPISLPLDLDRFSSLDKVINIVLLVLLAIYKFCKGKTRPSRRAALRLLVRHEQEVHPPSDADMTRQHMFRDQFNILRSAGRINASALPPDATNPVYLPRQSRLSRLIVKAVHARNAHASAAHTAVQLKLYFHIPRLASFVKTVLDQCTGCRRTTSSPFQQPPVPQLPSLLPKPIPHQHPAIPPPRQLNHRSKSLHLQRIRHPKRPHLLPTCHRRLRDPPTTHHKYNLRPRVKKTSAYFVLAVVLALLPARPATATLLRFHKAAPQLWPRSTDTDDGRLLPCGDDSIPVFHEHCSHKGFVVSRSATNASIIC
ncbi:hypothetical protein QR680_007578 [Steinernema hermaphroditum]|uniref:Integrase zinc-binding domain-containing protein n=1 Tax=Steinernema hermaphroditum TaxID=289476 RepID=A0AA39M664_9BILA|nr:hypothetical protein QR680_007578 [Steinernema hermaphroditum]